MKTIKPFYHISISIAVIMTTVITTGVVFTYNPASKTSNDIIFIVDNAIFLAATVWIVINAIKMVKQSKAV